MKYCNSLTKYSRFKSREVKVGQLVFGGDNPIHVQSMTTTDTMDTEATVSESIRMIEAGCKLVRITAPSRKEAENLRNIKDQLRNRGYNTPIVADIHYTPNAAEIAARIVDKVRINPGNFADKKQFQTLEYSNKDYENERPLQIKLDIRTGPNSSCLNYTKKYTKGNSEKNRRGFAFK